MITQGNHTLLYYLLWFLASLEEERSVWKDEFILASPYARFSDGFNSYLDEYIW